MLNHGDKYPARPGCEPGTSRLQSPVDTDEPLGHGKLFLWMTDSPPDFTVIEIFY